MPRKKIELPPPDDKPVTDQDRIRDWIIAGVEVPTIALSLHMDEDEFMAAYAELLRQAPAEALAAVSKALYTMAISGSVPAAIFWLRARAGWRDRGSTDDDSGPARIENALPGSEDL